MFDVKNCHSGLNGVNGQKLGQINSVEMVDFLYFFRLFSDDNLLFVEGKLTMERKRSCVKAKDRALKWSLNYENFY